ncbi:hypothetical protein ACWCQZ_51125 [Streptomyces sp. NPDC002285]
MSYLPGGSPEVMLSSQVEEAEHAPLVLVILGLTLAVIGALACYPPALLVVLGSVSALIASIFVRSFIAEHRRGASRAPSAFGIISMILLLLFLGGTVVLCFATVFTG